MYRFTAYLFPLLQRKVGSGRIRDEEEIGRGGSRGVNEERSPSERVAAEVESRVGRLEVDESVGAFDVADGGEEVGGTKRLNSVKQLLAVVLVLADLPARTKSVLVNENAQKEQANLQTVKDLAVPEQDVPVLRDEWLGRDDVAPHMQYRCVEAHLEVERLASLDVLDERIRDVRTW